MPGTVRALFVKPEKGAAGVSLPSVEATPTGFGGDYHSGRMARRQILLVSGQVLKELDVENKRGKDDAVFQPLPGPHRLEQSQEHAGDYKASSMARFPNSETKRPKVLSGCADR